MNLVRNLLPGDTRSIELFSAFAFIILALLIPTTIIFLPEHFTAIHPYSFWSSVIGFLGVSQLVSLLFHPKLVAMRIAITWMAGCFWIWISLADGLIRPTDVGVLILGISNLFAFLINLVLVSEKWNH